MYIFLGYRRRYRRQQMQIQRQKILHAMARAMVLSGPSYGEPMWLAPFWEPPAIFSPSPCQRVDAARKRQVLEYLRQGKINLDQELAPWTGGFFHGLKLSGALVDKHDGRYRIQTRAHPRLTEDLERIHFSGRLSPVDSKGRRCLLRCAAADLPPTDPNGLDVLAGILAGGRLVQDDRYTWWVCPESNAVQVVLEKSGVFHQVRDDQVWVSPFYGALLALNAMLPPACASRFLTVHKPALCPWLPMVVYDLCVPKNGWRLPLRAGVIPFICGPATRERKRWTRRVLHRQALAWGIETLPDGMKNLVRETAAKLASSRHDDWNQTGL